MIGSLAKGVTRVLSVEIYPPVRSIAAEPARRFLNGTRFANGHAAVVFRGRHVAAFTDLSSNELADYSLDLQTVGLMIERVFRPCHVNYLLLGNIVPHLHVHVVPRYLDDPAPERPLPWDPTQVPEALFAEQFQRLRETASSFRAK